MNTCRTLPSGRVAALLIFFLTACTWLQADVTGSILGTVRDPSGAVIAGAAIKATNVETSQTRSTTSDGTGAYRFLALPVGKYTVEATHSGFQSFVASEIDLTVNAQRNVEIQLQVGAVEQQVEITAHRLSGHTGRRRHIQHWRALRP